MLLWVTPRPSLEGGATDTPHNLGVSGSRPSRAEVPPLVFGMITKNKVDGGQGAAGVGLDAGDHLAFGMIAKKKVDGGQVDDEIVMIEMMEL